MTQDNSNRKESLKGGNEKKKKKENDDTTMNVNKFLGSGLFVVS